MNKTGSKFTLPCVTLEQTIDFDVEKPETWTASPLVNAVLESLRFLRPFSARTVAEHFGLEQRDIAYGFRAVTGMAFPEFIEAWRLEKLKRLRKANPRIKGEELIRQLGYSRKSALSNFLRRNNLPLPPHKDTLSMEMAEFRAWKKIK